MAKSKSKKAHRNSTKQGAGTVKPKGCCNPLEAAMQGNTTTGTECNDQLPLCPTGVPCVFVRDAAQNLVCIQGPSTSGRKVLCIENGVIFWGTPPAAGNQVMPAQSVMREKKRTKRRG